MDNIPNSKDQRYYSVMKNIDEIFSYHSSDSNVYSNNYDNKNKTKEIDQENNDNKINEKGELPKYIFIFIDEINMFLPKPNVFSNNNESNAVTDTIIRTIVSDSSRGNVLFSAQQFKSQTDERLQQNTGLHILTKLGLSELQTSWYSFLDDFKKIILQD